MPPRSPVTYPPLDVAATRSAVAAGRSVRVGIVPMNQFPDGSAGRIRAVGDPEIDGAEFIQVEVFVGGIRDVIPFAPTDLSPIKRTQSAPEPEQPAKAARTSRGAVRSAGPAGRSSAEAAAAPATTPSRARPSAGNSAPLSPNPHPGIASPVPPEPGATGEPNLTEQLSLVDRTDFVQKPKAGRSSRQAPPGAQRTAHTRRPALTITISTAGADNSQWQLEVRQGARSLIKAAAIQPARAWELVGALGNPELNTVVATALSDQRQETQARADRLATELEAARADLAAFPLF